MTTDARLRELGYEWHHVTHQSLRRLDGKNSFTVARCCATCSNRDPLHDAQFGWCREWAMPMPAAGYCEGHEFDQDRERFAFELFLSGPKPEDSKP